MATTVERSSDSDSTGRLEAQAIHDLREALARGELPSLANFAARYPQLKDRFADLLHAAQAQTPGNSLELGAQSSRTDTQHSGGVPPEIHTLGDFRLLHPIGRGGMGVVYEAEQTSLRRRVALKVMPYMALLDERHLQRFRNEALAAASLDHPHIVHAYSFGQDRGIYYFAMKLIEGRNLSEVLTSLRREQQDENELLLSSRFQQNSTASQESEVVTKVMEESAAQDPAFASPDPDLAHTPHLESSSRSSRAARTYFQQVAQLAIQAAEALEYAHQRGVVHRDIKPSNLMIDAQGHLWITDFGLAQVEHGGDLTRTGDLVGTLRYMSPEQASGLSTVDHRTDVYSLGITLYELLTLRPAFDEQDRSRLLKQLLEHEPKRPRKLQPALPRDLETIVLKAIHKAPVDRYPSAHLMAEDLKRFVAGQPLLTRRQSWIERSWRWVSRHRLITTLTLATMSTLLAVIAIFSRQHTRLEQLVGQLDSALIVSQRARIDLEKASRSNAELLYSTTIQHVGELRDSGEYGLAQEYLTQRIAQLNVSSPGTFELEFLRGQWQKQIPLPPAHSNEILGISFSPDQTLMTTCGRDLKVLIWNAKTLEKLYELPTFPKEVRCAEFSADGKTLVVTSGGMIHLYDVANWQEITSKMVHRMTIMHASLSPDGQYLYTGSRDGTVRGWRFPSLEFLWEGGTGSDDEITCGHLSPDGRLLAVGANDRLIRLYDALTGEQKAILAGHRQNLLTVRFSPNGQVLASGSYFGEAILWSVPNANRQAMFHFDSEIVSVDFDSTGQRLAIAEKWGSIRLYSTEDDWLVPRFDRRIATSEGMLKVVRWYPHHQTGHSQLVTGHIDGAMSRWQLPHTSLDLIVRGDDQRVCKITSMAFEPGDHHLRIGTSQPTGWARASLNDAQVQWQGLDRDDHYQVVWPRRNTSRMACFHTQVAEVWHERGGEWLKQSEIPYATPILDVRISPTGRWLALGTADRIDLWDCDSQTLVTSVDLTGTLSCMDFSEDEAYLGAGTNLGTLHCLSLPDLRPTAIFVGHAANLPIKAIRFDRTGRTLLSGGEDHLICGWDIHTGERVFHFDVGTREIHDLALSPDGQTLILASDSVSAWRVNSGVQILNLIPKSVRSELRDKRFQGLLFSDDGRQLAVMERTPMGGQLVRVLGPID